MAVVRLGAGGVEREVRPGGRRGKGRGCWVWGGNQWRTLAQPSAPYLAATVQSASVTAFIEGRPSAGGLTRVDRAGGRQSKARGRQPPETLASDCRW